MDAINLLGSLLGGQQAVSPSGRRVLQNNHPAFRTAPQPVRVGGGLGGVLAGAAKVYAARKAAEAQQRAAQQRAAAHQRGRGHLDAGYCPDDFGGLNHHHANQQAELLIRAMVYAAIADGRMDRLEEQALARELGTHVSPDELAFVRRHASSPLRPCDFAREVPPVLADDVYAASLLAITLDNNAEARYLHELAHELNLSHAHCNQLHQHYGEPILFR